MGGSIIRAKSGLDDGWTTLASQAFINPNAGAVKVSGNRIAYYVTGGPINVRDSLSGPWTSYPIAAGSGWTWDISPQLVVVRLNSTTILGRTTLSGGWTTLANNFSNIGPLKVSGDRIATIADGVIPGTNTTTGVLKAKDGINGAWFNLEYGVTDFDISTQNVVALGKYGNSSLVQAKKGLNDPWSNLGRYGYNPIYSYGSRAAVWQGITSGIPNLDNVLMWDPVTGQRILVADRVYQGFWSIGPNQ
jgi:hypothetical protein